MPAQQPHQPGSAQTATEAIRASSATTKTRASSVTATGRACSATAAARAISTTAVTRATYLSHRSNQGLHGHWSKLHMLSSSYVQSQPSGAWQYPRKLAHYFSLANWQLGVRHLAPPRRKLANFLTFPNCHFSLV